MSITYRTPGPADAAPLAEMARDAFLETFGPLYAPGDLDSFLETTFGPTGLPAQVSDPAYTIRIAVDAAGSIAGFAKLAAMGQPVDHPPGSIELKQLYVLKRYHGAGVGPALMDWAIGVARSRSAPALYLSVYAENWRALAFYRRIGFVQVGTAPFVVGDKIDIDPVMMLDLQASA
jgi:ribosomal protein S18 acetylase RimI-like enzyme